MKLVANLSIQKKLMVLMLVSGLLTAALGGMALQRMASSNHRVEWLRSNEGPTIVALQGMRSALTVSKVKE